jgi:hypothetical protein
MIFEVSKEEIIQAKKPHDLFLVNLIANHILAFVGTLGLASSWAWPMLVVPITSFLILSYTIYRANKSLTNDPWFVKCHWQLALKRSKALMVVIALACTAAAVGVLLYSQFGVMKEAAMAFVGGLGLLPVMVTVLILIIMESDALHQANKGELPESLVKKFPDGQYKEIEPTIVYKD